MWCDRLLRGLDGHEFEVYALSRSARQESAGWRELPRNVTRVRTAPLWGGCPDGGGPPGAAAAHPYGRRDRRRFAEHFTALAETLCAADPDDGAGASGPEDGRGTRATVQADRFAAGLYGLAELAVERGGLAPALRSEQAVRILESACRARGALRAAHAAQVADLLAVSERLERALRPLSLDWYGEPGGAPGLSAADLCHAVGGGPASLPGLLAKRFFGVPLLITEYGVRLREHYLASAAGAVAPAAAGAPVRALLASFQGRLAREAYAQAQLITPGNAHARRWQERCGAEPARLRTVYPGMDAAPYAEVGEAAVRAQPVDRQGPPSEPILVWAGRIEPAKDLIALLHAFARVRKAVPGAKLRIVGARARRAPGDTARGAEPGDPVEYESHCRALAAQLFPDEAADPTAVGECPVSFEELGSPTAPSLPEVYAAAGAVVLSSVVEGFPASLVEAMFCARATVSTDVGAVCEVIGGTGLVVPPRNPGALADACVALLRDPVRSARLGAAARSRALELFTVEQNTAAFQGIYLEVMSHRPASGTGGGSDGNGDQPAPHPFARPAESHVPGRWAGPVRRTAAASPASPAAAPPAVPSWARTGRGSGQSRERETRERRETGERRDSVTGSRRETAGTGATATPVPVGADVREGDAR